MSTNRLFRYVTFTLLLTALSFSSFALSANVIATTDFYQDKRGNKQDRGRGGKDSKKPEVKEVPQSRKQQKPSEVKRDKKQSNSKDNKRRN